MINLFYLVLPVNPWFKNILDCVLEHFINKLKIHLLNSVENIHWNPAIGFKTAAAAQVLSCAQFFATPWGVACQALLSMGFSRQEYQSGLPGPLLGELPDPGIEPEFSVSCISETTREAPGLMTHAVKKTSEKTFFLLTFLKWKSHSWHCFKRPMTNLYPRILFCILAPDNIPNCILNISS